MDLIVLESPNKVKDVHKYAAALGLDARVVATVGHMLDLPPMAEGACVDIGRFAPSQVVPRDARAADRVAQLKRAIGGATRVIVATDPDREGEAIAAQVWGWIPAGRAFRAYFEEITAAGVERGLRDIQPTLKKGAVEAALTRRIVDRLAGWHATSLVFERLRQHRGISAGRLQSAGLRLVVDRFREHQAFRPETTFGVRLRLRTSTGGELLARLVDADGEPATFVNEDAARAIPRPASVRVTAVVGQKKAVKPRPPFEATSWLQVAAKALGLGVKDATAATQALFEGGQTTYPRTDTVRVSEEAVAWAREEIGRRYGRQYLPAVPWVHKDRSGDVQGAHEAIRPTIPHETGELEGRRTGEWAEAYGLIEARFLASQAAARIVEVTTLRMSGGGKASLQPMAFEARGEVELFDGWRRILATDAREEDEGDGERGGERGVRGGGRKGENRGGERGEGGEGGEDGEGEARGVLPKVSEGEELVVVGSEVTRHTTKPKPLFTQASLVAELQRLGIGRPSTYPALVPLLLSRGWVKEQAVGKRGPRRAGNAVGAAVSAGRGGGGGGGGRQLPALVPEQVGVDLCDTLKQTLPSLVDYAFTAQMEAALDAIEQGKRGRVDVGSLWWAGFERELGVAKALPIQAPVRKDLGPCPRCSHEGRSGRLRLIAGKSKDTGKAYEFAGCDADSREAKPCGFTAPASGGELQKLAGCPSCGRGMKAIRRKDGGHSWLCQEHGWFLAGRQWQLVVPPACRRCGKAMSHRERSQVRGEFFWGCFPCSEFLEADVFGGVKKGR